jgi:L-serine dehydratase
MPTATGGGFVARGDEPEASADKVDPPFKYKTSESLLTLAAKNDLSIAELLYENEKTWRDAAVLRRAAKLSNRLRSRGEPQPLDAMEWVNVFAIAVNEENAAGGRVVTSPTNGAAGIIPAVLRFYANFVPEADRAGIRRFLFTAGAIGILYKVNASISGAEMGCQGEVGVACSMAAGGLAAALGGSNDHVEEAAEIGMEHNLGLTCDPIGGLVQIPCIERNAMGAVKAINAAKLAMHGDGTHKVTLDQVIETMRQTGEDMSTHYKETSRGGLAVNVPEC